MTSGPQTFIFVGRSGCGKGTQAELLVKYFAEKTPGKKCFHLESGAKFRSFISSQNYTSDLSKKVNAEGGLQPEFLAVWAWTDELIKNMAPDEHLIIDGTPRKLHEAEVLHRALQFYGRQTPYFIFLDVTRRWSRDRLLARKRADDNNADIEARLDWYESEVVQAIAFFRKNRQYHFVEVNGEQSIEKVHADILEAIEAKQPPRRLFATLFR